MKLNLENSLKVAFIAILAVGFARVIAGKLGITGLTELVG